MQIDQISIKNFRNFGEIKISNLSAGLNIFVGPNGSGKTNILEVIGLLSMAKSCRGVADTDMVRLGQPAAIVEIEGVAKKKDQY